MIEQAPQFADTLEDPEDRASSETLLAAIAEAEEVFKPYLDQCKLIDAFYDRSKRVQAPTGFNDPDFDLFGQAWKSLSLRSTRVLLCL